MKKKMLFLLKCILAMFAAFIALNLICVFYYNLPIHNPSESNSTDYVWEKNKFHSRGTEGFAAGTTDENGFNNLKTFNDGEIDVLIMGSSHMEAFNVAPDKNTCAVLNEAFRAADIGLNAYNIGISGHTLVRCLNNLDNAINEFKPQKYLVIETDSILPDAKSLEKVLEGTLEPIASHSDGIVGQLQKFPYLRLIYSQIKNAKTNNDANKSPSNQQSASKSADTENDISSMLNTILNSSAQTCESAGVKLIIFYNCEIVIDDKGLITEQKNTEDINNFKELCEKNNIIFINMYDSFTENYYKTNTLPRGFSNTSIGSGHLNEEGHRVIAERLFSLICE